MRSISDRPLFRSFGSRAASQCARGLVPLACAALVGCSASVDSPEGAPGAAPTGSSSVYGPVGSTAPLDSTAPLAPTAPGAEATSNPVGTVPGSPSAGGTVGPVASGVEDPDPAVTVEPAEPPVPLSEGGVTLRLLTQDEYAASVQALLGTLTADLTVAPDTSVAGFVAVGAALRTVTDSAATAYEAASRLAVSEVFRDSARWQELVGCQPAGDLSDACVATYIETFGRKAFRRDLTDEEVQQWLGVAQSAIDLGGSVQQALSTATVGMLQSPHFLYRVEVNSLDAATGRLKYDGLSMATRLSYGLTGGPPSVELLDAAAAGQLDTAEGVSAAAASLLDDPRVVDHMTAFFREYAQVAQVLEVAKSETLYPSFTAELQASMVEGAELFLKNIVLGTNADVRSFYDSRQTYADANLASLYGVRAPASGFEEVTLPAETPRVGILGQAALLAGHSQPDRTSPTRRGVFMLQSLLCTPPPVVPDGVDTTLVPADANSSTREILDAHRENPQCASCHALFDPLGISLEHFDAIGQYRTEENGHVIDASGEWLGHTFSDAAELSSILREEPLVLSCLLRNFYRNVNGRAEDDEDMTQIEAMAASLAANGYVWNSFLGDFVASEAFRSAPALPIMTESP